MRVKVASVGNVDYMGIDYRGHLDIPAKWVEVESLDAASKACRDFIENNSLGGGNWAGGVVIDENRHPVGYISYNGRIWTPEQAKESGHDLEADVAADEPKN